MTNTFLRNHPLENARNAEAFQTQQAGSSHEHCPTHATPKGRVRFSETLRVCLIPTRREMSDFNADMHWTSTDCERFRLDCEIELRKYATKYRCTGKEAIIRLYQIREGDIDALDQILPNIRKKSSQTDSASWLADLNDQKKPEFSFVTTAKTDVELRENT